MIFVIEIFNHLCCLLHLHQTSIVVMVVTTAPDQQACILQFLLSSRNVSNGYTQPAVMMVINICSIFPHIDLKNVCTLSKHAVTEYSVISFIQHTLALITSLLLDRLFAQSRNFYENNMILRFILSDPAKSSLESSAWIDGYDYQNNFTQKTLPL